MNGHTDGTATTLLRPSGDSLVDELVHLYTENEGTSASIASRWGTTRTAVLDAVRRAQPRTQGRPRVLIFNTHDEAEITARYGNGATIAGLAAEFGVNEATMLGYIRGLGAHVPRKGPVARAARRRTQTERAADTAARLDERARAATERLMARQARILPPWHPLAD